MASCYAVPCLVLMLTRCDGGTGPRRTRLGLVPRRVPDHQSHVPVPAKDGPGPMSQAGWWPGRELSSPQWQGQSCPPPSRSLPVAEVSCPSLAVASAQPHSAGLLEKRRRKPIKAVKGEKTKRPSSSAFPTPAIYRSGLEQPGRPPGLLGTTGVGTGEPAAVRPEGSLAEPTPKPAERRLRAAGLPSPRTQGTAVSAPVPRTRGRAGPDLRRLGELALPRLGTTFQQGEFRAHRPQCQVPGEDLYVPWGHSLRAVCYNNSTKHPRGKAFPPRRLGKGPYGEPP